MRLIDADELKKHIRRCDDSETRATFDFVYDDDIDDAPTVDVLEQIQADIYEHFMTIDGGVHDKSALKCMEIIDKYKASEEISERNMKMWEEIFKAERSGK